jgi:hypothetical protein
MKKHRLRIVILILLALLAVFLNEYRGRTALGRRGLTIAVTRPEKVSGIIITDDRQQVVLRKENGTWMVNDHQAREKAVEMLMQTLGRLRVSNPAPIAIQEELNEKLSNESVRIDIRRGRRSTTYFIHSAGGQEPTWILVQGSSRIYNTEVTGFSGNVASLFVPDESYWRDNLLFNYNAAEIAEVIVNHADNNDGSFVLRQSPERNFSLYGYPQRGQAENINDSLAIRYMANFFYTPYERLANAKELRLSDSLRGSEPDYLIKVTSRDGTSSEVRFHKIITGKNQQDDSLEFDVFRLHAIINDGNDMVIVPWHSVDLLLRRGSYFLPD